MKESTNLIINFAPNGAVHPGKAGSLVPLNLDEVLKDVRAAYQLGITLVHLHAREATYAEMIAGIREFAPELVICVSTTGRGGVPIETRLEPLLLEGSLKPDLASLTPSSLNFLRDASTNSPQAITTLAQTMLEKGIVPELEVFDFGMLNYVRYMLSHGLLKPPHFVNLILGNVATAQADIFHAGALVRELPPDCLWSLGGLGGHQLSMNATSIAFGGGVRVGLEDNLWYDVGRTKPANNLGLLERVHQLAAVHERKVMSPTELRRLLNLQAGFGQYGRAP